MIMHDHVKFLPKGKIKSVDVSPGTTCLESPKIKIKYMI